MNRVYLPIGSAEYAKLVGVSTAVARRRIQHSPGATKVGSRWQMPILASDYARLKGIRPESARKRRTAVRAQSKTLAGQQFGIKRKTVVDTNTARLRDRAVTKLSAWAATRPKGGKVATIEARMSHASPTQLAKIDRMHYNQWVELIYDDQDNPEWLGDDGICLFLYL